MFRGKVLFQQMEEALSNVSFYLFIIWWVKPYNVAFSVAFPFSAECWLLLKWKLDIVATLLQGLFICRCQKSGYNIEQALQKSGYNVKLSFQQQPALGRERKRNRKRNINGLNPPYNEQVKTNIGKSFFHLLKKHFPPEHRLHKICNKNVIKLSYSLYPKHGHHYLSPQWETTSWTW